MCMCVCVWGGGGGGGWDVRSPLVIVKFTITNGHLTPHPPPPQTYISSTPNFSRFFLAKTMFTVDAFKTILSAKWLTFWLQMFKPETKKGRGEEAASI